MTGMVEAEVDEDGARPGQDHGEGGHRALRGAYAHVTEVSPIDLGLLTRIGLDAQVDLAAARLPHLGDVAAQDRNAVLVTTVAQFENQASRGQFGQCRQALDDVGLEGLDNTCAGGRLALGGVRQCSAHRRVVNTKPASHRLDGQLLRQHQPTHLHAHLRRDH
jgi:hypothetical protein